MLQALKIEVRLPLAQNGQRSGGLASRQRKNDVGALGERLRLWQWGQLEMLASADEDPFRLIVAGKIAQLRQAQESGVLNKNWDPTDMLVFVSQLATSWAGQGDLVPAGPERDAFLALGRQAIETVVRQLFPSGTR
ncbi:hypothetical protein [Arthrobacter globiformis]|uniref:hypothetical protein n=1 Tax=Arthrobacter globiformis TaxID=1665 RepID=UPI002783E161|nr:hypothetical protein [Arthrobacter globiformis]MDQ0867353.1 hypothetical protein [Arthrobacter globiformis]